MTSRKELGDQAEQQALNFLLKAGLTLLERNFRVAGGEIDLIMRDGQILVLVEVRARKNQRFGGAAASVNARKQQHLLNAAQRLLQQRPEYRRCPARFDLIAIDEDRTPPLEWIKDAFRA